MDLRDNEERGRYELVVDGEVRAVADYRDRGTTRILPHVETDPAHRNQGLACRVVAFALDDIRAKDLTVLPVCPFAVQYVREHPEHQDLLR